MQLWMREDRKIKKRRSRCGIGEKYQSDFLTLNENSTTRTPQDSIEFEHTHTVGAKLLLTALSVAH